MIPRFLIPLILSAAAALAQASEELPPIFNGKDLTGWKTPTPASYWKVVDGVLVGESDDAKKGSMLYTEKSYGNVVVEAEVRWSGDIDSGIMLRKPEIQLQIGTSRSLKRDMTCSFYVGKYPEEGQAKGKDELLKPGEWNKIRLEAKGDTYTVWFNGKKVTEYTNPAFKDAGPIGLQIHPGLKMKVEFRNIGARALE
jgi:3-keto-disaccharide hydrolase